MPGLDELELAWAAGFFDGEGSVSLNHNKREPWKYLHLSLAQVDRRVLDRFASAVGKGKVRGPYSQRGERENDFYTWSACATPARVVVQLLMPYLSERNRLRIEECLSKEVTGGRTNGVCKRGHPLEGDNLYVAHNSAGVPRRQCKTCRRFASRKSYEKRKRIAWA